MASSAPGSPPSPKTDAKATRRTRRPRKKAAAETAVEVSDRTREASEVQQLLDESRTRGFITREALEKPDSYIADLLAQASKPHPQLPPKPTNHLEGEEPI